MHHPQCGAASGSQSSSRFERSPSRGRSTPAPWRWDPRHARTSVSVVDRHCSRFSGSRCRWSSRRAGGTAMNIILVMTDDLGLADSAPAAQDRHANIDETAVRHPGGRPPVRPSTPRAAARSSPDGTGTARSVTTTRRRTSPAIPARRHREISGWKAPPMRGWWGGQRASSPGRRRSRRPSGGDTDLHGGEVGAWRTEAGQHADRSRVRRLHRLSLPTERAQLLSDLPRRGRREAPARGQRPWIDGQAVFDGSHDRSFAGLHPIPCRRAVLPLLRDAGAAPRPRCRTTRSRNTPAAAGDAVRGGRATCPTRRRGRPTPRW